MMRLERASAPMDFPFRTLLLRDPTRVVRTERDDIFLRGRADPPNPRWLILVSAVCTAKCAIAQRETVRRT